MRVAVVGAGLAGLAAAREFVAGEHQVVVFEKSRGAGGRTSTRRSPHGRFDHGAPFLHDATVNVGSPSLSEGDSALGERPLAIEAAPALARWRPEPGDAPLTVGRPAATSPAKVLAVGLDLRTGVRVGEIVAEGRGWSLLDDAGASLGTADAVLVTAPAPQAAELLPHPALAARVAPVAFAACWSVMVAWEEPLGLPRTVMSGANGLTWAVSEAPKPGREPGERWVLQADAALSAARLEDAPDEIASDLLARFAALAGAALPPPVHLAAHRWRYARPLTPLPEPFLRSGSLVAAGDWCGGTDAGAALRSGRAAAASLLTEG